MATNPVNNTNLAVNTTPITVSANTLKLTIAYIMASIFLLILVQYYPKYIVGLVLLIILSILLYDYQQIASLLGGL